MVRCLFVDSTKRLDESFFKYQIYYGWIRDVKNEQRPNLYVNNNAVGKA